MIAKPACEVSQKKCRLSKDCKVKLVMDDEIKQLKPKAMPADKQSWNIEDLQAYVDAMKAEIVKVEALITQKNKVHSAAAALFGGVAPD